MSSQIARLQLLEKYASKDPVFKRSGEARPDESSPALILRYRSGMLRRTEADPAHTGKKAWVGAGAAYAFTLDKLWARHRQAIRKKPPAQ